MRKNILLRNQDSGFVLLYIAILMAIISLGAVLTFSSENAASNNTESFLNQKRVFYVAEGVRDISTVTLENYLAVTPNPTNLGATNALQTQLATACPVNYNCNKVGAKLNSVNVSSVIPNGAFKGMPAYQSTVDLGVSISQVNGSNATTTIQVQMSLAQIFLFQFMVFIDQPYGSWFPGPQMNVNGPLHVNGDFCANTASSLYFSDVTVSGKLMALNDPRCKWPIYWGTNDAYIATGSTHNPWMPLTLAGDNGCTNCNATGIPWKYYEQQTWNGNALDQTQGVSVLQLPGAQSGSFAQYGASGDNFTPTANTGNVRFLLDPPLPGQDSAQVAAQKYSGQADVRIIDGVWYLADPANAAAWPGIPIWSDHPGGAVDAYGINVGQDDIRARWNGTATQWPAGSTPQLFSFYEYSKANNTIVDNTTGVISYGNLAPAGVGGPWSPAFWLDTTFAASPLCQGNAVACAPIAGNKLVSITSAATCGAMSNEILSCAAGSDPQRPTFILNATRGGYVNGHFLTGSPAINQPQSKILPVNFDMGQFQAALANNNPGELGSYFGAGGFAGHVFNGIVYISSDWPGALTGFGTGAPVQYPNQGAVLDPLQMLPDSTSQQQALPMSLCSNAVGAAHPGIAGQAFDKVAGVSRFKIPDCASYGYATISSYPNAIRVYNGANLNPAILVNGISFVSNLPVYIMGDYNTSSDTSSVSSAPWLSSLVAGDQIVVLSNSWNDVNSAWDVNPSAETRAASNTTINTALISGWIENGRNNSNQFHADPAQIENWNLQQFNFTGSNIIGFYPVYDIATRDSGNATTFEPPNRNYSFDPHFSLSVNQPPGTPAFSVSTVSKWQQQ